MIEKSKDYIYYRVSERCPSIEYVIGAIESLRDTINIINMCSWTFSLFETIKLFFIRYIGVVVRIVLIALLWNFYFEEIATELFYIFSFPRWMLPICLFIASESLIKNLNELRW